MSGGPIQTFSDLRTLPLVVFAEQVGHDLDAGIARMVQTRQAERCLHRLQHREAGVVVVALNAGLMAEVGLDRQDDAVLVLRWVESGQLRGAAAVVVFVPHDLDSAAAP